MAEIRVAAEGPVAEVVLDRPARKNAMSLAMWHEVSQAFDRLGEDGQVRGIVLRGEGEAFCVGADISEFGAVRDTAAQVHAYDAAVDRASDAIAAAPAPVIAAIEGYCVGGGCGLAMACDFRIAAPGATFFIPAAKLGIVYGMRETQNLLALVGLTRAKRILYGGERFGAEEALRIGFIDEVADAPLAAARDFAQSMAGNAPLAIAGAKAILTGLAMGMGALEEDRALALVEAASQSLDHKEARAAFAEKRAPVFMGR